MAFYSIHGVELRIIPSWPDYAAGEDGHIYRVVGHDRRPRKWPLPYRLKERPHKLHHYLMVTVYRDDPATGKRLMRPQLVHNLVAEAWYGPRPDSYDVDHGDGGKHDNRPGNLEYVTEAVNYQRAGQRPPSPAKPPREFTPAEVDEIRRNLALGYSVYHEAKRLGVWHKKVWNLANDKTYRRVRQGVPVSGA